MYQTRGRLKMISFDRRHSLGVILFSVASFSRLVKGETGTIQLDWEVPQDALATAHSVAHFTGSVTPAPGSVQEKSPVILFIIVGSVVVPYLVNALIEIYRGRNGGAVVDTTVTPVTIRHDPELQAGIIILKSTNGTTIVNTKNLEAPTNLLKAFHSIEP